MIQNVPKHIAIIMDGNGRWAKKHNVPINLGHKAGSENVRKILNACKEFGVKIVTLYAFSKENWNRSRDEVQKLMSLLTFFIKNELSTFKKNGIKLIMSGDFKGVPTNVKLLIKKAIRETKTNKEFILNIAFNYGGRQEIITAIKKIIPDIQKGRVVLNEKNFAKYLYTKDLPDPDLLIRTSGEMRISNFLLWQIAYTEIYVTDTLWPDFSKNDLKKAILAFQKRERRFGKRI